MYTSTLSASTLTVKPISVVGENMVIWTIGITLGMDHVVATTLGGAKLDPK